jgi:phosphatidylglycerol:prolipoprotein diacylglycerol transferase
MIASLLNISFLTSYSFGFFSVLALFLGSFVFWKKGKEEHYDEHELIDLIVISILWGLIGSRVVYISLNFSDFGLNLLYWLSFWSRPGMHWTGLFGVGLLFFIKYCRNRKWNTYKVLDLSVIGISLAQAIVNLGVFLSASPIGITTKLPIGIIFPGSFEKRHPIGLYACILWLVVFFCLYWLEGKYRRFIWYQKYKGDSLPGFLFFVYMISSGIIGGFLSLFSVTSLIYSGINVDFTIRFILILIGCTAIFLRSGLLAKFGFDRINSKFKRSK